MDVEQVGASHWVDIEQGFLQKKLIYMCHGYGDGSFHHTHTSRVYKPLSHTTSAIFSATNYETI
jgi:hypothetical protein